MVAKKKRFSATSKNLLRRLNCVPVCNFNNPMCFVYIGLLRRCARRIHVSYEEEDTCVLCTLQGRSPLTLLQSLYSHFTAVTVLSMCTAVTLLQSLYCSHFTAVTLLQSLYCSHFTTVTLLQSLYVYYSHFTQDV